MDLSVEDTSGKSSLEDVEFLARSAHRVGMLEAVATRPCERSELRALTGASSATVGRMLRAFETRRWITRNGHEYEVTPLGAFVARGFVELIDRMTAERKLRAVGHLLPIEDFDLDLRHLADARLTLPNEVDPTAPHRRWAAVVSDATDRLWIMTRLIDFPSTEAARKKIVEDGLPATIVLTSSGLEAVATDPGTVAWASAALQSGTITGYRCDADFPSVTVADGVVLIELIGEKGIGSVLIESENEAVLGWAEATFERYKDEADPVPGDVFATD